MKNRTIEDAAFHTGLSSTSRLHNLFVNIEGMTPGEFKNGGQQLEIKYWFTKSPFDHLMIGSTGKGICNLSFVSSKKEGREVIQKT